MRGVENNGRSGFFGVGKNTYGLEAARHWHGPVFDTGLAVCSRHFHQRTLATAQRPRTPAAIQPGPIVSPPFVECFDTGPRFQPVGAAAVGAASLASFCSPVQPTSRARCLDVEPISGTVRGPGLASNQRPNLKTVIAQKPRARGGSSPDRCDGFRSRLFGTQKKTTGKYSAPGAALGGRTLKCGQSRFFVGYKKHTFRLWLRQYERGVLLVPLVSWTAPANLGEGCLLHPSVAHCWRRWQWRPDF